MKKTAKLIGIILALIMLLGLLAACGDGSGDPGGSSSGSGNGNVDKQYIRMSAGPSGGFNYTLFAGIADQVNKEFPGYYDIQVDISTGTSENARNVMMHEAQFSMVGLDVVKDAWNAEGEFEGMEAEQIYHVISGPSAIVHIMAPADSDIDSIEDMVGRKIGVGKGVMSTYLPIIFEAMGLPTDTTEMTQVTITDMCNGMADGTIDASIYATPYPTASISDFAMTTGLKLIPIPADVVAKIAEEYPFFYVENIPASAYSGLTQDTPTMARRSAIMTYGEVDDEVVYNFLKVILENNDELVKVHANAAELSLENALSGLQTPLHPGAEKYYRDVGLID